MKPPKVKIIRTGGGKQSCLPPPFNEPIPVTSIVTESNTMKQLYKIIAALICILLFNCCDGKAVDLERASNHQSSFASQNSSKDSSIQEELKKMIK